MSMRHNTVYIQNPHTTYHIIIIVAAKHCRNFAPKYSHFEFMKCVWFLTLFLTPLGLSRSQDEVRMLWLDGEKGEFLPVWRASSRVLFPWRGGPTSISFINLQASAQRSSARRNASTAAGPDTHTHTLNVYCVNARITKTVKGSTVSFIIIIINYSFNV